MNPEIARTRQAPTHASISTNGSHGQTLGSFASRLDLHPAGDAYRRRWIRIANRGSRHDNPGGRALAGMLAVFAEFERDILRDRVKAGIAQARKEGRPHGRPPTVRKHAAQIASRFADGTSKRQIAVRPNISRASVRRVLSPVKAPVAHTRRRAA